MAGSQEHREIVVRRSADQDAALALARQAELEVSPDSPHAVDLWGAYAGERLVGTVSLGEVDGLRVVERIAVLDDYRGRGVGGRLLAAAEEETRRNGHAELWATARTPAFFVARGFEIVAEGEQRDLLLADCAGCPQRGTSCRPAVVRKTLTA